MGKIMGYVAILVGMLMFTDWLARADDSNWRAPGDLRRTLESYAPKCPKDMDGKNTVMIMDACPSKKAKWNRPATPHTTSCMVTNHRTMQHATVVIEAYREGGGTSTL